MQITPDNRDRAKELFDAALALDSSQRASFLAENCRDESLRQQVENLLANYQEAGDFLDDPALNPEKPAPDTPAGIQPEEASRPRPQSGDTVATATSTEAEDNMVGRQFGAYKLVRRIGQGGMAAVFLASRADDEYRKLVAVKLVQPGLDSRDLLNRFRNERQTLAGLDHPNIVKLLDGGTTSDGLPFLVMDYVEGSPIDAYCDQHKLSVDDRLHLFSKVCDAVQYAHQKLVVHRDLKPSNILVAADGTPRLLDFGIAKVLNPEPSAQNLQVTQTGTRCMTPAYASPEQMRGKQVTPATDIYSLGVVLYELLTGHRPYRLTQHTPAEMERAICDQEPETPSTAISRVEKDTSSDGSTTTKTPESVSQTREGQPDKLRRRLRGDLDNIVLKALQKDPQRRYDSVEKFSQDIGRHLQHLPVKARPSTVGYRISKYLQWHKVEVSAASAIVLVVIATVPFAFNLLGLRDRMLGTGARARLRSPKASLASGVLGILPAVSCESLIDLKLPESRITSTRPVPAGSFTPSGSDPIQDLPSFCQIQGVTKPTTDSEIRFEVWMPDSGWNGRFRAVGNTGFGGMMNYDDMAPALRRGYATASTDTGHIGDDRDAVWALGHPEKVADVGYRAVHEITEKSKAVLHAFYGQAPKWSFFEGCSNGGREALMEAQRFPDDYQGILAGAPAIPATRLLAAGLYNIPTSSPTYIPASKLPTISAAAIAACDAQDGVADGILTDPRHCHFDPAMLLCRGADTEGCLTSLQVAQLKKIYAGLRTSDGKQLYPGYLPGGEEGDDGWAFWLTGAGPGQGLISVFSINYFRNLAFDNPTWDYRSMTAQKAAAIADMKLAPMVDAIDPDLRRYQVHGGKLILYHGWSDPGMSPLATTGYYDQVAATLGVPETETFVRLYMAPGMHHCSGGVGPNYFGQFDLSTPGPNAQQSLPSTDPQHNISSALEQWVEKGVAPVRSSPQNS